MKNQKQIYDRRELLNLVNKEHSCIILKKCNRKIELHAKYLRDVKAGIKEALDKGLNKFDYSLNGILLDYQNLNVLADEWSGRIVGRFGEFLVTVNADFFVFDPKIGSLLEGVVNSKSNTHVGCLVHKRFNAMILKPDVEGKWNCENIQIGDKIIFTIVDHVFSTNIPHIEGVLATEYSEKHPKHRKKKSKILSSQTQELSENGKFSDEMELSAEGNKKTNKLDEMDSSNTSFRKQEDLTRGFEIMSPKSKLKKSKIDIMDVTLEDTLTEIAEESLFEVKKKKKKKTKEKEKNETIIETEKSLKSPSKNSMPLENPTSVFSQSVISMSDGEFFQVKQKKKKRDKEKDLDSSECAVEHKKKKKKDKRKDSESNESLALETVERKKHSEDLDKIEESAPKPKKKKKREKEFSSLDNVGSAGQCESNKNRLCIDDNNEINVNPVDLIDQLMNVVPTDLILRSEATPNKGTSLENVKSPKFGGVRKSETPDKSRTPRKKKREGSITEDISKYVGVHVEGSPSKKRKFEGSPKSPKSVKHDKSLFSDSEESGGVSPTKALPEPVVVDVGSCQWNFGAASGKAEVDEVTSTQGKPNKPNNINKKERKRKKDGVQSNPDDGKSAKKTGSTKGEEPVSSIIKSSLNKKKKKDLGNKSVTWDSANMLPPHAETKTTLLERFHKCLGKEEVKILQAFNTKSVTSPKKEMNTTAEEGLTNGKDKKSNSESSAAREKIEKGASQKGHNKSGLNVTQGTPHSKVFSLEGVDTTQLNTPVNTSTPKSALNTSVKVGEKVKKSKTKNLQKPSGGGKDDERASIINALLEQAKESLGIVHLFGDSPKNAHK